MGHYDLDYEMEAELQRLFGTKETKENGMQVKEIYVNAQLGSYYSIENDDFIMMVAVKDGNVLVIPGWYVCSLDCELEAKKFERKALKALRRYLKGEQ